MSRRLCLLLMGALGATSCGVEETAQPMHGVLRRQIRPTDGAGWQGNGYGAGVTVLHWDSPGGHFRMHYTTQGNHAVPPADADSDGVPDFVQQFGKVFDQVYAVYVEKLGFRAPLDDSLYHDRPDFGGDGRFDVYLQNQVSGADGYTVVEACKPGLPAGLEQCACYMVVENDFVGFTYPTPQDGMKVLASHEFFHAIQNAYRTNLQRTFSEGTAVWATQQVFPEERADFDGFIRSFFAHPDRSLDDSSGGPADSFPYGVAVWPTFLAEKFGSKLLPAVLEELSEKGTSSNDLDAVDVLLKRDQQSSLTSAFATFALWNYFTGDRAVPAQSYQQAASMPMAGTSEVQGSLPQRISGEIAYLSAQYFHMAVSAGTRLKVFVERNQPLLALHLVSGSKQVPTVVSIGPDQSTAVIDSTGDLAIVAASTARQDRYLPLSLAVSEVAQPTTQPPPTTTPTAPEQPPATTTPSSGGGCAIGSAAPAPRAPLLALLLGALLLRRSDAIVSSR